MAADRKLNWGDEEINLKIGKDTITAQPTTRYTDTVTLPRVAEVRLRPSIPGWGGYDGTTYFLEQHPPALQKDPETGVDGSASLIP